MSNLSDMAAYASQIVQAMTASKNNIETIKLMAQLNLETAQQLGDATVIVQCIDVINQCDKIIFALEPPRLQTAVLIVNLSKVGA